VYVDDCGSKSCLKTMTIVNFTPVPALAGGILIGLASVWLLAANGRIAGISGILHGLFAQPPSDRPWRIAFIAGLVAAGFIWHAFVPGVDSSLKINPAWMALAGFLVGLGTRVGGGCTSGHGVCGLGRLSLRSLVAVMVFMACGMLAVYIMRNVVA
jgi:uncharacterized membrane protein YedE/YeeE